MKWALLIAVGLYALATLAWAVGWRSLVPHAPRHFTDFTREPGGGT